LRRRFSRQEWEPGKQLLEVDDLSRDEFGDGQRHHVRLAGDVRDDATGLFAGEATNVGAEAVLDLGGVDGVDVDGSRPWRRRCRGAT